MPYILHNEKIAKEMLDVCGVNSIDDLFSQLPDKVKIKNGLNIASGLSELELKKYLNHLASKNTTLDICNSFLGAGIYDHYIPSALNHLLSRTEFYTSYTPYQPECSQGVLQAIYEYQSFMCILTGMDVTNASLYDGATALAESVLMSARITRKNKVIVSNSIHPEYRQTLNTYLSCLDMQIEEIAYKEDGVSDFEAILSKVDDATSCVAIQSPNFFGVIEDIEKLSSKLKEKGVLLVLVTNPMSLALLKTPADLGVDIVCGDGQVFGSPPSFGGPTFGFLACGNKNLRQLPGRVVGKTNDEDGKVAFCLTLQTREQHIRRDKATSNICSNESLNAIAAAIYLSLVGGEGLKKVAHSSHVLTNYLHSQLKKVKGVKIVFSKPFFNEFAWSINNACQVLSKLESRNIFAGVLVDKWYEVDNVIISACTEKKTKLDIDDFIKNLKECIGE